MKMGTALALRAMLVLQLCLIPVHAAADAAPSSPLETAALFGLLLCMPFMILFTIVYLFSGRGWAMACAMLGVLGSAISTLVWSFFSMTMAGAALLATSVCILLLLLKRSDLRPTKPQPKDPVSTLDKHPNVKSYRHPVFSARR